MIINKLVRCNFLPVQRILINSPKVLNFYPHNYLVPNLVGYYGIPHQARGKHLSLLFAWHRLDTNTVLSKKCRKMEETFKHRRRIFVIIFVLYLQGVSLEHMNQDKDGNFVQLLVKLGW